jgi:TetR/AcrR family transcriptional regulator, regulator of cefoperazone and chloramphenicol sensitivity
VPKPKPPAKPAKHAPVATSRQRTGPLVARRPAAAPSPSAEATILHHAQALFARQGFEHTTIRQIVAAAGANLAAVNYHFGDKQGLYLAVVRKGFESMLARQRDAFGPPPTHLPPKDRLAWFIRGMVERTVGEHQSQPMFQILMREMISPTLALDEFVSHFIRPQHDFLRSTVATLTNRPPNDPLITPAVYSVVSQILFYKHCTHVIQRLHPVTIESPDQREQLANHLISFSLAGLATLALPSSSHPASSEPLS